MIDLEAWKTRAFYIALPLSTSGLGNVLSITLTSTAGVLEDQGDMVCVQYQALLDLFYHFLAQKSKKAAALVMVDSMENYTCLFTSHLCPDAEWPRYINIGATLSLACGLCTLLAVVLRIYLRNENESRQGRGLCTEQERV